MRVEICAKKNGTAYIVWGSLFLAILFCINYMAYFSERGTQPSKLFMGFFSLIWLLACLSFISTGMKQRKKGGQWTVIVDDIGFMWSSPNYSRHKSIDQNFNYSIEEIDYTETFTRTANSHSRDYYVHLKDGRIQEIRTNSGINLDYVFKLLQNLGIQHFDTFLEPTKPNVDDLCIA